MTTTPDTPAGGAVACDDGATHEWAQTCLRCGAIVEASEAVAMVQRGHKRAHVVWIGRNEAMVPDHARLYLKPPATAPLDAVPALVAKWRKDADFYRMPDLRHCADELEALTREATK